MKQLNVTPNEALQYIAKKLKIKYLILNDTDAYVRKLNTLKRIETLIQKDIFVNRYSNEDKIITFVKGSHYVLDFWVDRYLCTIRCKIKR